MVSDCMSDSEAALLTACMHTLYIHAACWSVASALRARPSLCLAGAPVMCLATHKQLPLPSDHRPRFTPKLALCLFPRLRSKSILRGAVRTSGLPQPVYLLAAWRLRATARVRVEAAYSLTTLVWPMLFLALVCASSCVRQTFAETLPSSFPHNSHRRRWAGWPHALDLPGSLGV